MTVDNNILNLDFAQTDIIGWEAIDDKIMGGNSQSHTQYIEKQGLRFSGKVSLENNGGFASVRSSDIDIDLSQHNGISIRVKGDGKTYKLSLRTDSFFDGISYQHSFATNGEAWQEFELPFADFIPTHHGIELSTVAPLQTSALKNIGIFIANGQEGPFQIDIAWMKTY